ncbi:DUF1120 domain-containing protein [Trinickia terrae]|uniref:DUF1120 domain-containing protein n=1 Tax=Trinickia terrae TaxID=2571161 RepID=A0A4U1IBC2_9BURK|nr:DUF1120 domain-containing protein [Trinickia terrae]TKC90884.1 DUF1120 domain-containing protein [Trinickia terrae]
MKQMMIAKAAALTLVGAAALATAPAFAEGVTTTLTVTGKLTPGACNVSFDGGGSVDYGNIAAASLSKTAYTALTSQTKNLSVVCGSATNAYVSVTDNRAASAIKDAPMQTALGATATQVYGLGTSGTGDSAKNIGAYTISMGAGTTTDTAGASTKQAAVMSSTDKSAWTISTTPVFTTPGGATYYSTGASASGSKPVVAKTFVFPVTVKAALNNTTDLPVSSNVALDGSATFTVAYN